MKNPLFALIGLGFIGLILGSFLLNVVGIFLLAKTIEIPATILLLMMIVALYQILLKVLKQIGVMKPGRVIAGAITVIVVYAAYFTGKIDKLMSVIIRTFSQF